MTRSILLKALSRPGDAVRVAVALLKGHFYKVYFPLRGRRFTAGRNLRVFGRLHVTGPGQVIFGDDVCVWMLTTPFTHSPNAVITVGDAAWLAGARFGCAARITVGRQAQISECRIMDTDFHAIGPNRRDPAAHVRTAPVTIGDNVWIAPQTAILPGTTIGDNSVIAFGAICGGNVPANIIMAGNPARVAGKVPVAESPLPPQESAPAARD